MKSILQLVAYLKYLLKAKTKYAVHSPFVFEFTSKVLTGKSHFGKTEIIESIRKELLSDKRKIGYTDFGAGKTRGKTITLTVSEIARNSAKEKKHARLLFNIVNHYQSKNIIELGTSLGISTMYMAKANALAKVFTIEGCHGIAEKAKENIAKAEIKNIKQFTGNFDDLLTKVLDESNNPDLFFFDGNHSKQATLRYFEQCLPYAENTTIFIFDDIHWSQGMSDAWNNICTHPAVTVSIDLFQLGIVFFRKELTKQHFILKY